MLCPDRMYRVNEMLRRSVNSVIAKMKRTISASFAEKIRLLK